MALHADLPAARAATLNWSLVVPVKVLAQAKSRLTGIADNRRSEVALAMAADTIAAAVAADTVAAVLVVTDDPEVGDIAAGLGAIVLADTPQAGLNEAFAHGAAYSEQRWPDRGRAGLAGDLPALRPGELTAALAASARVGAAFVPDADGTGTTLYAAPPGARFAPQFGPASRDLHLAAGLTELSTDELIGLRRDVDTMDDLRAAAKIGLGPRTRALVAAGSWV
ncbi:MAG TPA: 2-phospho-L-lactate guanylyltransferase [Streptosporangiaceae bacterium]|nr:2-phospho-L-lactate guanylyltransferase [Streptosporangiaceae bacterium]